MGRGLKIFCRWYQLISLCLKQFFHICYFCVHVVKLWLDTGVHAILLSVVKIRGCLSISLNWKAKYPIILNIRREKNNIGMYWRDFCFFHKFGHLDEGSDLVVIIKKFDFRSLSGNMVFWEWNGYVTDVGLETGYFHPITGDMNLFLSQCKNTLFFTKDHTINTINIHIKIFSL